MTCGGFTCPEGLVKSDSQLIAKKTCNREKSDAVGEWHLAAEGKKSCPKGTNTLDFGEKDSGDVARQKRNRCAHVQYFFFSLERIN